MRKSLATSPRGSVRASSRKSLRADTSSKISFGPGSPGASDLSESPSISSAAGSPRVSSVPRALGGSHPPQAGASPGEAYALYVGLGSPRPTGPSPRTLSRFGGAAAAAPSLAPGGGGSPAAPDLARPAMLVSVPPAAPVLAPLAAPKFTPRHVGMGGPAPALDALEEGSGGASKRSPALCSSPAALASTGAVPIGSMPEFARGFDDAAPHAGRPQVLRSSDALRWRGALA